MFVRTACMFSHEQETTFNHLQWILCFHESLREEHGMVLIMSDDSPSNSDTFQVINR